MATLAAAGLPMIQRDNAGATVAIQSVGRDLGVGLFFEDYEDLATQLRDTAAMASLRANVAGHAASFTFDAHVDRLIGLFRRAIAEAGPERGQRHPAVMRKAALERPARPAERAVTR
jgi:hypothetical protein